MTSIGALRFLSSPASDFVNGHTLYDDGGMLAVVSPHRAVMARSRRDGWRPRTPT